MSDTSAFGFGQFVPGFDFLQNLAKSAGAPQAAGSAIPGMSSWVAPTLSVEELDKRIQELKAVQFWLEQNGTALKATIQALEVQKMTLTTLQGMNVNMTELAKAFTARPPEAAAPAQEDAAQAQPESARTPQPTPDPAPPIQSPTERKAPSRARRPSGRPSKPTATASTVDPMQWWGALTQQFQNIASSAMQDAAAKALQAQATGAGAAAASDASDKPRARAKPTQASARRAPPKRSPAPPTPQAAAKSRRSRP